MINKTRIAILGLGGVGGYFGALLAGRYFKSDDIEIIFITKEETARVIKQNGLKLITNEGERIVHPAFVTGKPETVGHIDFLICTVKSYDLEESLKPVKSCTGSGTVILLLLNGVDAAERISKIFPGIEIWEGCVYLVSRLIEPGVVKQTGNIHSLYYGSEKASKEKLNQLNIIFKEAGIDAHLSENIEQTIWEKFLFISAIASLTSYLDLSIGDILTNKEHKETLQDLLNELKSVADAKGIKLPDDILAKTITKMENLPYETTSSMHNDFKKNHRMEYDSLTGYVVKLGHELNVKTPTYKRVLSGLLNRKKN